ncbi:hypothetical protein [Candidatus Protochlamydia phocaeensis]|uniref:hypothetical protein n=1 Tax=Candidatus Protochlamydia phocaeensis TaxID=1414722 RepID=UPI0008390B4C|nr:hypothetical protein [Candidatus Protochlamydia phocaeensis]
MVYSECCREKLFQSKINGQSRPFIDQNLQLRIPGAELPAEPSDPPPHNPIYSHYAHALPAASYLPSTFREAELNKAMADAQQSYEAWKKMHQQLMEAAQQYFSQSIDQQN